MSLLCISPTCSLAYAKDLTPSFGYLSHIALLAVIGFATLEILLHVGLYLASSAEDRVPKDERELLIDARATKIAYISMLILSLLVALLIALHPEGFNWLMGNMVLLTIASSELIKNGSQILFYRRGV